MTKDFFGDEYLGTGVRLAQDVRGQLVILFPNKWAVDYFAEKHPKVELFSVSQHDKPAPAKPQ